MKVLGKFFLLVAIAMITFTACDKDDDDNPDNNNNQNTSGGTMSCKADGTDWSATLAVVATKDDGLKVATATGTDANSHQCFFSINNYEGTGDYEIGGSLTNPNMARWTQGTGVNDQYTTTLGIGSGMVSVTEATDTGFKGTFHFTAKNSAQEEVTITDGVFEATFQ